MYTTKKISSKNQQKAITIKTRSKIESRMLNAMQIESRGGVWTDRTREHMRDTYTEVRGFTRVVCSRSCGTCRAPGVPERRAPAARLESQAARAASTRRVVARHTLPDAHRTPRLAHDAARAPR
jgi:hypothetical protein